MNQPIAPFALALLITGCSVSSTRQDVSAEIAPPQADREAILAMAGEFEVGFNFDETVVLQEGYQRRDPKRSGAKEAVVIVADEGDHIVLQHLLLVGDGDVIKHWRQDWTWRADHRLVFSQDQTWTREPLAPEQTQGRWTQCVYGVADAPRYCGTGQWNHRYGQATWTSDRSWRPLPRREYTTRDDYNALNVENRHTITPNGWTHEQDNSKVLRDGAESKAVLAREFGFNEYRRSEAHDFSPAYSYWAQTGAYWARVREIWQRHFDNGAVVLTTEVDGMPIIEGLFTLAEQAESGQQPDPTDIEAVFEQWVKTPEATARLSQSTRPASKQPAPQLDR